MVDAASKEKKGEDKLEDIEQHPILSEHLLNIGCSYKGHKKTENLIQVLYVFQAANVLE